jgi:hypothetical protein
VAGAPKRRGKKTIAFGTKEAHHASSIEALPRTCAPSLRKRQRADAKRTALDARDTVAARRVAPSTEVDL